MVDEAPAVLTGRDPVLGAVFAGGASRRYGSDKALAMLDGIPMLQRVIERAAPQVDKLVISGAGRDGFPLSSIPDGVENSGPLSALCSVLAWAEQEGFPLVATFSCDAPFIPPDLVTRLRIALADHDCAVAGRGRAMHPTFALWRTAARDKVETAFHTGMRSLRGAIAYVDPALVDFSADGGGPGGDAFFNINCAQDMLAARQWLAGKGRAMDTRPLP